MKAWLQARDPEEPIIPWWLAGTIIGLLITISLTFAGHHLGAASEYEYTGGRILSLFSEAEQLPRWQGKLGVWWETILLLGVFVGAALAVWLTRKPSLEIPSLWRERFGTDRWKRYAVAFLGGFIMLFGARLAGGCTSGHMISGISQLALSSFVFAVTIFVTGILVAKWLYDWRTA
ncbi:MAG: YeeE/YedE thiosulfate transporter family protein [Armatimonadota bacterium]